MTPAHVLSGLIACAAKPVTSIAMNQAADEHLTYSELRAEITANVVDLLSIDNTNGQPVLLEAISAPFAVKIKVGA